MALIEETATSTGIGDVGELYDQLARRLEHIVRLDVGAPDVVIEDACQFAWSRLLHHRHRVHRETAMSWLARTAVHEAFKLLRRDRRDVPFEAVVEPVSPASPHELAEWRERLDGVGRLPERQQRVLWLHALGLSYAEIAVHEQCTLRTVERQLLRARQKVRDADRVDPPELLTASTASAPSHSPLPSAGPAGGPA
jgi:RNA polymerase sigma factor (sigma-70 family)